LTDGPCQYVIKAVDAGYFLGKVTTWVATILSSTEVPTGYTVVDDSLPCKCWPDGNRTVYRFSEPLNCRPTIWAAPAAAGTVCTSSGRIMISTGVPVG